MSAWDLSARERREVVALYVAGVPARAIADAYSINRASLYRNVHSAGEIVRDRASYCPLLWLVVNGRRVLEEVGKYLLVECVHCGRQRRMLRHSLINGGRGCSACRHERLPPVPATCPCGATFLHSRIGGNRRHLCDACKRRQDVDRQITSRSATLGRKCASCGVDDSETTFYKKEECQACNRAAIRNGRCEHGHARFRSRPCSEGCPPLGVRRGSVPT